MALWYPTGRKAAADGVVTEAVVEQFVNHCWIPVMKGTYWRPSHGRGDQRPGTPRRRLLIRMKVHGMGQGGTSQRLPLERTPSAAAFACQRATVMANRVSIKRHP